MDFESNGENKMFASRIILKGDVQMVGFRYYTVRIADRLGVRGYVRNLATGDVEIVAEADEIKMKEFIDMLKKGPPSADVREVEVDYNYPLTEKFSGFNVRY